MEPEVVIKRNDSKQINLENYDEEHKNERIDTDIAPEMSFCDKHRYYIFLIIKICFGSIFLCAGIINGIMTSKPQDGFFCIHDWTHISSAKVNTFLQHNLEVKYFLLVSSTLLIYFIICYMFVFWIIKGKSWRFPFVLGIFVVFRFFVQFFMRMINPEGYQKNLPPAIYFFSNSVQYNDFFYSLYVGIPIICSCEFYKFKNYVMFGICLFSSFYELLIMIFTRGHYIIDLFAGLIFAHYFYMIVDENIHYIDKSKITLDPDEEKEDDAKKE